MTQGADAVHQLVEEVQPATSHTWWYVYPDCSLVVFTSANKTSNIYMDVFVPSQYSVPLLVTVLLLWRVSNEAETCLSALKISVFQASKRMKKQYLVKQISLMFMSSYLWVQKNYQVGLLQSAPCWTLVWWLKGVSAVCFSYFPLYFFIYWMMNENDLTGEYLCKFHLHGVINRMCLSRITQVLVTDHRSSLNDLSD